MQKPLENDPHKFLALLAGRSTSHYRKNTAIFVQGADADTVIYIQDGQVKVTVTSEHGKEAILAILGPGQFFGEGCLGGQRHRKATTTTMTDCRLISIEKDSMLEALLAQPGFSKFFMDHLLSRNSRIEGDVIDQLFNARALALRLFRGRRDTEQILELWMSRWILRDGSFGQHCGLSGHASQSSLLARYRSVLAPPTNISSRSERFRLSEDTLSLGKAARRMIGS
jgi:CRP-like cAMP-binding protein